MSGVCVMSSALECPCELPAPARLVDAMDDEDIEEANDARNKESGAQASLGDCLSSFFIFTGAWAMGNCLCEKSLLGSVYLVSSFITDCFVGLFGFSR